MIFSRTIVGASLALAAWADFTGKVVGVADGDTVTVLDAGKVQHKVRLTGIDALFQPHDLSFYLSGPNTSRSSLLPCPTGSLRMARSSSAIIRK